MIKVLSAAQAEEMAQDSHHLRHMMHGLARHTASAGHVPDNFTYVGCNSEIFASPVPKMARDWIQEHSQRWFYMVYSEVELQRIERMILSPASDLGVPSLEEHPPFDLSQGGDGHIH